MSDSEKINILKNAILEIAKRVDELAWDTDCAPYNYIHKRVSELTKNI